MGVTSVRPFKPSPSRMMVAGSEVGTGGGSKFGPVPLSITMSQKNCQLRQQGTRSNSQLEHQRDLSGLLYLKFCYIHISPPLMIIHHSDNPLWSKHFRSLASSWLSWSPALQIWSNSHSCSKSPVVSHMIHISMPNFLYIIPLPLVAGFGWCCSKDERRKSLEHGF